jgi:integrase
MSRTVRDAKIETREARRRLTASGQPYYRGLDQGLHIGYRKGKIGGKWVVRWRAADGYKVETLDGIADDTADANGDVVLNFAQAQAKAREKWVAHERAAKGMPVDAGPYTIAACIEDYIAYLANEKKTERDSRWRAEALILPTLGNVVCMDLTKRQIDKWRDAIAAAAPRLRTKKGAEQQEYRDVDENDAEQHRRRRNTANRTLCILKAALNRAWRDDDNKQVTDDSAWRAVKPFKKADAARVRYLKNDQKNDECRRLINAAEGDFRDLVRAALATGCRFGELAALQVGDYNPDAGTLQVAVSKSGESRHVVLNGEGIALFERLTAGRRGGELMLRKRDGGKWGKNHQCRPMAEACARAGIDPPANFHCLRHTYASLTIMAGAPLLVVAKNLGHTDTRMVERHYGHLSETYIASAIRAAAPQFGFVEPGNVTPLAAGAA